MWYISGSSVNERNDYSGRRTFFKLDINSIENAEKFLMLWHPYYVYSERIRKSLEGLERYLYLGVLDIDLKFCSDAELRLFQESPEKHEMVDRIKNALSERKMRDFDIQFSGNKGFHVYIYEKKTIKRLSYEDSKNVSLIKQFLLELYGNELYDIIDKSIYFNGIRNPEQPNPKTGQFNKSIYSTSQPPRSVFAWFLRTLRSNEFDLEEFIKESSNDQACKAIYTSKDKKIIDVENDFAVNTTFCYNVGREHANKCTQTKEMYNGWVQNCLHSSCVDTRTYLRKIEEPVTVMKFTNKPKTSTEIILDQGKYLPSSLFEDIYNDDSRHINVILSPMGTGKSYQLKKLIENKNLKILFVTTRKTQTGYFSKTFDLFDYQAREGTLYYEDKIVVCLNSLMRILNTDNEIPEYDILILDEIVSIINTFSCSLMHNIKSNASAIYELLKCLIKDSRKVFMMDGVPDESIEFFLGDMWRDCNVYQIRSRPDNKIYEIIDNPYYFMRILENKQKTENKKTVVVTDSKKISQYMNHVINSNFPSKKVCCINGDSDKDIKNGSTEPDTCFIKYDVVIYNTAIGPGASFNIKGYFDYLFVIALACGPTPIDLYQLMSRIRNFNSDHCFVSCLKNDFQIPEIYTRCNSMDKYIDNIIDLDKIIQTCYLKPVIICEESDGLSEHHKKQLEMTGCLSGKKRKEPCVNRIENYYKLVNVSGDIEKAFPAPRHKKRLVYETNEFMKLIIFLKNKKIRTFNMTAFKKELTCLITRNGGMVLFKQNLDTENSDSFKRLVNKTTKDEKHTFSIFDRVSANTDPDKIKCLEKKLGEKVSDYNAQYHFLKFMSNSVVKEAVYQSEINQFDTSKIKNPFKVSDRTVNMDVLKLKLYPLYENLLNGMGCKDLSLIFNFTFSDETLYYNCDPISKNLIGIGEELTKNDELFMKARLFVSDSKEYKTNLNKRKLVKDVLTALSLIGISCKIIKKNKPKHPLDQSKRFINNFYAIDRDIIKIRFAASNFYLDDENVVTKNENAINLI